MRTSKSAMRSWLWTTVGVAAGVFVLAACSSDDTNAPNPTDAGSSDGSVDAPGSDTYVPTDAGGDTSDAAEAGQDSGPAPPSPPSGMRDRVGRAYVSVLLVSPANRESYNAEAVEAVTPSSPAGAATTYGADFQSALVLLDHLDGTDDWNGGGPDAGPDDAGAYAHPLVAPWIGADALIVDPNAPFSTTSYLDIEANGAAHTTCGGRWPGEDALDVTMSYLVKKSLTGVSDGVQAPAKPVSMTFPYLAEPF